MKITRMVLGSLVWMILSSVAFAESFSPGVGQDIAMNSAGQRAVVWVVRNQNQFAIHVSRNRNGAWSSPITIHSGLDSNPHPRIGLNDQGTLYVAWIEGTNQLRQARAAIFDANNVVVAQDDLSNLSPLISDLQMAVSPTAGAIVTWKENQQLVAAVRSRGQWLGFQALGTRARNARIAYGSLGFVVWEEDVATPQVYAALWNGSSWSLPKMISQPSTYCAHPSIAVNQQGKAIAAWTLFDGVATCVGGAMYQQGAWGAPTNFTPAGENPAPVVVAMNDHDEAVAVWAGNRVGKANVVSGTFYSQGSWSAPQTIALPEEHCSDPQVAMGGAGEAIAVWKRSNILSRNARVFGATMNQGSWGAPSQLSSGDNLAILGQARMNASNESLVAWSDLTQGVIETRP